MPKQKTIPYATTRDASQVSSTEEPIYPAFRRLKKQFLDSRIISLAPHDTLKVVEDSLKDDKKTPEEMADSILTGLSDAMDALHRDVEDSCSSALRYMDMKNAQSAREDLEHASQLLNPSRRRVISSDTDEEEDLSEDPLNLMYRRYVFKAQDASGRRISVCSKRDPGSFYYDVGGNETWTRDTTIQNAKRIRGWTKAGGHVMVDPETGLSMKGYTLQPDGTFIQGWGRPPHAERPGASDQRSGGPPATMASSVPESASRRRGPLPPSMSTGRTGIADPTQTYGGYSRPSQASSAPGVARPTTGPSSNMWSGPFRSSIGGLHQYPIFSSEYCGYPQMLMVPMQA